MLGELIGVEYLYQQTGEVAKVYKSAIQELETADVCVAEDESYVEPVDFDDLTLSTFDEEEPPHVLPSTSSTEPSENPHVLPSAPCAATSPFGPSQTPPTAQSAAALQWTHRNMSSEVSSSAMQSAFPYVRIQVFHTLYVGTRLFKQK